jgi:hypothetical protein
MMPPTLGAFSPCSPNVGDYEAARGLAPRGAGLGPLIVASLRMRRRRQFSSFPRATDSSPQTLSRHAHRRTCQGGTEGVDLGWAASGEHEGGVTPPTLVQCNEVAGGYL